MMSSDQIADLTIRTFYRTINVSYGITWRMEGYSGCRRDTGEIEEKCTDK